MNNTKTLAIVAIFMAATLVVGTFAATATTQTALAYQQKKRGGSQENSRDGNTVTLQACKQDGTESGFDNSLAQECENLICTHPGNNATCVQEGAAAQTPVTPVKLTCEQCFTKFLSPEQITLITPDRCEHSLMCACVTLFPLTLVQFESLLTQAERITGQSIDQAGLIQCLLNAGIHFNPT